MNKSIKSRLSKIMSVAIAAVAVPLLSSCSQFALVNSETYNNADLAAYKTFRIVTPDQDSKLAPGMEMVSYYNIAAAIREQMVERGYTEDPTSPMMINIGITKQKEIQTEPLAQAVQPPLAPPYPNWGPVYRGYRPWFMYPRGYYWPGYYDPNAQVITGIYDEGVLTMDFVNVPEHLALYSASVATVLDGQGQFRNLQEIAQAVKTLFSQFPVPLLPQYRTNK